MANNDSFLDDILNPPTPDLSRNFDVNDALAEAPPVESFVIPVGSFDFTGGAWKVARRASRRNTFALSFLGAIFFLVVAYGWYSNHQSSIIAQDNNILVRTSGNLQQQINTALTGSANGESLKTLISSIQSAQTAIKSTLAQEPQYVPILKSLQAAAGSSITINSVTFPSGTASTSSVQTNTIQLPGAPSSSTAGGGPIVITGTASSYSALSAWTSSLATDSYLTSPNTSFTQSSSGSSGGIQFTTNATLSSTGYVTDASVYLNHLVIPKQLLTITQG